MRLSGVYLAMLTLAFAQITWAITYQWDSFTGGSNGLTGVWPAEWLSDKRAYYWLTLALVAIGVLWLRRVLFSPFGYALRAGRDSAAARRRDRHRRQAHAVGGLRHRRHGGGAGRRALCVLQGQHLAGIAAASASRSTGW